MSEEEIIKYIKDEIENETDTYHWFDDMPDNKTRKQIEESINAHQGLLDLYNKEKALNEELQIRYKIENDKYNKEKEKNRKLDRENQALYESINCDDNTMLARLYQEEKEKNKELENRIKEYETLINRQKELEQEKDNLMKQGWL